MEFSEFKPDADYAILDLGTVYKSTVKTDYEGHPLPEWYTLVKSDEGSFVHPDTGEQVHCYNVSKWNAREGEARWKAQPDGFDEADADAIEHFGLEPAE